MTKEEWKAIVGFEDVYEISNHGFVKSVNANKILIPTISRGYFRVRLQDYEKSVSKRIHRLVAEHFIPNPDNKEIVNHKDGNKFNNHIDNLEWMTVSENGLHSYYELGHGNIRAITMIEVGGGTLKEFPSVSKASEETGIPRTTISSCLNGLCKTAGGYKWEYKNQNNKGNTKSVIQLDIDGNFINKFNTIKEAVSITGVSQSSISGALTGKQKTAGNFKWIYNE